MRTHARSMFAGERSTAFAVEVILRCSLESLTGNVHPDAPPEQDAAASRQQHFHYTNMTTA
jgi:hypothetical protein